jgi:hypothetical protein
VELAISDPILAEVERVLTPNFHWTSGPLTEALLEIAAYTVGIHPTEKVDTLRPTPATIACLNGQPVEDLMAASGADLGSIENVRPTADFPHRMREPGKVIRPEVDFPGADVSVP